MSCSVDRPASWIVDNPFTVEAGIKFQASVEIELSESDGILTISSEDIPALLYLINKVIKNSKLINITYYWS